MPKQRYSQFWYGVGILLAANVAVWYVLPKSVPHDFASVVFFDVGQGDSAYVRTAQGNDILIDGGPDDSVLGKLGRVMPFLDRKIELVILTHPHADHISGLVEVLKRYEVGGIVAPDAPCDSASCKTFFDLAAQKNIPITRPMAGMRIFLDEETVFDVYYPASANSAVAVKDLNDASLVGKLTFGAESVLFTGDAGADTENFLSAAEFPLVSGILKIGHHGSATSSSRQFLDLVSPKDAVIS
ncbi:MBL fold metallo-hydrolase, partial [bacterium]